MFKLIDCFNNRTISRHRTLDAAVKAKMRYSKQLRKIYGTSSYLPMKITRTVNSKDFDIDEYDLMAAEQRNEAY